MKSIAVYVAITALFYFLMDTANTRLPQIWALAVNTLLIAAFMAHILWHEFPTLLKRGSRKAS